MRHVEINPSGRERRLAAVPHHKLQLLGRDSGVSRQQLPQNNARRKKRVPVARKMKPVRTAAFVRSQDIERQALLVLDSPYLNLVRRQAEFADQRKGPWLELDGVLNGSSLANAALRIVAPDLSLAQPGPNSDDRSNRGEADSATDWLP
jgi:hypothetical protein